MYRIAYHPGLTVRRSGNYWVYHYAHRASYPAHLEAGDEFPECAVCGNKVRYEEAILGIMDAPSILEFEDFRHLTEPEDDLMAA